MSTNPYLEWLLPAAPAPQPVRRWATVTSSAPLQIQLDAEDEPLDGSPSTLVPVHPGDRVFVLIDKRRATIIGKSGALVDTGVITLAPPAPFDAPSTEGVNVARYGNQVTLSLIVVTSASTAAKATVLSLPVGFRPAFALYFTSYGAAANIGIYTGGTVTSYTALGSGAVVRLTASYYTADPAPTLGKIGAA